MLQQVYQQLVDHHRLREGTIQTKRGFDAYVFRKKNIRCQTVFTSRRGNWSSCLQWTLSFYPGVSKFSTSGKISGQVKDLAHETKKDVSEEDNASLHTSFFGNVLSASTAFQTGSQAFISWSKLTLWSLVSLRSKIKGAKPKQLVWRLDMRSVSMSLSPAVISARSTRTLSSCGATKIPNSQNFPNK